MSPVPTTPSPFIRPRHAPVRGREEVVEELLALVRSAVHGHGAARTLVGPAGIGKTAVLDEVIRRAGTDSPTIQTVRIRGLEAEVEMAWSGLGGMLDGFLDRIDALPRARAAAIRGALAMADDGGPVEPFAVAVATRDLLAEAGQDGPILIVVDDVPWVDQPTRLVLGYVAEHVELEHLAVIGARRSDADSSADLGAVVDVGALPDDAADELLVDAGVTNADVRRRLRVAGGGNALVLVEAANLLDDDERSGRAALPDPLPVGTNGRRAAQLVLARLDPATRAALVVVAADSDGDAGRVRAALAANGHDPDALAPALAAGVLVADGERLVFRHPLIRSSTYHGARRSEVRAAHRVLAGTLPERSPARAWHLARSALGPDEEIATALDDAATQTAHIGAPSLAARTWETAALLSPDAADRARRLRRAAGAALDAGHTPDAAELLGRAEEAAATGLNDELERVHRLRLRCRLPPAAGGTVDAAAQLRAAAGDVLDSDVGLAADLLIDTLERLIDDGTLADILATIDSLVALRDQVDDDRGRRVDVAHGAALIVRGDPRGEALLDRYKEIGPDRPIEDATFLVGCVAPALGYMHRTAESFELLTALEADLRARGAIRPLVDVLSAQAMANHGRSFPAALAASVEAVALAEVLGTPHDATLAACELGLAAAVVGDRARCEQAAALLATVDALERRMLGPISLAYLALNEGRLDDADALYRRIAAEIPLGRGFVRWETEWVETLAKSGRREEGAAILDQLVRKGHRADVLLVHEYERARGFVAEDEATAHAHFARSIEDSIADGNPFSEGRARLAWGEQLRRVRRRADAREHLDRAVELFTAIGATSFAVRAVTEARAAGGQQSGDDIAHRLLTPHELQVARLVVGGASTRDVAAKLFISPRTIEAHLSTIFRKLGVRNRGELAARAIEDPILQP